MGRFDHLIVRDSDSDSSEDPVHPPPVHQGDDHAGPIPSPATVPEKTSDCPEGIDIPVTNRAADAIAEQVSSFPVSHGLTPPPSSKPVASPLSRQETQLCNGSVVTPLTRRQSSWGTNGVSSAHHSTRSRPSEDADRTSTNMNNSPSPLLTIVPSATALQPQPTAPEVQDSSSDHNKSPSQLPPRSSATSERSHSATRSGTYPSPTNSKKAPPYGAVADPVAAAAESVSSQPKRQAVQISTFHLIGSSDTTVTTEERNKTPSVTLSHPPPSNSAPQMVAHVAGRERATATSHHNSVPMVTPSIGGVGALQSEETSERKRKITVGCGHFSFCRRKGKTDKVASAREETPVMVAESVCSTVTPVAFPDRELGARLVSSPSALECASGVHVPSVRESDEPLPAGQHSTSPSSQKTHQDGHGGSKDPSVGRPSHVDSLSASLTSSRRAPTGEGRRTTEPDPLVREAAVSAVMPENGTVTEPTDAKTHSAGGRRRRRKVKRAVRRRKGDHATAPGSADDGGSNSSQERGGDLSTGAPVTPHATADYPVNSDYTMDHVRMESDYGCSARAPAPAGDSRPCCDGSPAKRSGGSAATSSSTNHNPSASSRMQHHHSVDGHGNTYGKLPDECTHPDATEVCGLTEPLGGAEAAHQQTCASYDMEEDKYSSSFTSHHTAVDEDEFNKLPAYHRRLLLDLRAYREREEAELAKEWRHLTFQPKITQYARDRVNNKIAFSERLSRSPRTPVSTEHRHAMEAASQRPSTVRNRPLSPRILAKRRSPPQDPLPSFQPTISPFAMSKRSNMPAHSRLYRHREISPRRPKVMAEEFSHQPEITDMARDRGNGCFVDRLYRLPKRGEAQGRLPQRRNLHSGANPPRNSPCPQDSAFDRLYRQRQLNHSPPRSSSQPRYSFQPNITQMARRQSEQTDRLLNFGERLYTNSRRGSAAAALEPATHLTMDRDASPPIREGSAKFVGAGKASAPLSLAQTSVVSCCPSNDSHKSRSSAAWDAQFPVITEVRT